MQEDDSNTQSFDVQYPILLSEDLITKITIKAAADGMKPSAWIRSCIIAALEDTQENTVPEDPAPQETVPEEPVAEDPKPEDKKSEEKPDKVRSSLLTLLKRDKHVREMIKDISNEELPEEELLKKRCEELAASITAIMKRMAETRQQLSALYSERQDYDYRIKSATNEIGVLKHISHGMDKTAGTKEQMEKYLKELETLNAERQRVSAAIPGLERTHHEDETLLLDLKREYNSTLQKLEAVVRKE